ncbi:MAG: hypothetical protein JOZ18_15820 [Chloroflexi bacterium]|nr:hypothetical protein [Chloroflexota bacterium]
MSQSLLAFDTDHIKGYVFGTSKLKEIRGASSRLDYLNRILTREMAESTDFRAITIYANGGSALFLVDSDKAEKLGKAVQQIYREKTGGGASITYAIQPIPDYDPKDIMTAERLNEHVTMLDVLKLLRLRLRLAKDSLQMSRPQRDDPQQDDSEYYIAAPSHALLSLCNSCGINYAEEMRSDLDDPDESEGLYCRVCVHKREEDRSVRNMLHNAREELASDRKLWGRILQTLYGSDLPSLSLIPERPKDFNAFSDFSSGKDYLGLIYADANSMGEAIAVQKSLEKVQRFAKKVDDAVFEAMGEAIRKHLPVKHNTFPFDILLVGGDDIVMVTPAQKALQVAHTLAQRFYELMNQQYTLSAGVVLAPVKYPFNLQRQLVEETIKAAKMAGSENNTMRNSLQERAHVNCMVVTGNTSLSYPKVYAGMKRKVGEQEEFCATMRPYTLPRLNWLLEQLSMGNQKRLGRTKLHQLREAILKLDRTRAILESLMVLSNWKGPERKFIKEMVKEFDTRTQPQQKEETLFPWYLDGNAGKEDTRVYRTPLLDFVELYDFVSLL